MNNEPVTVTLPINLAHLTSLSGLLRDLLPVEFSTIFSAQVFSQASMQGIDMEAFNMPDDYSLLLSKTIDFSIPTAVVAEVGHVLMDHAKEKDSPMAKATKFLIDEWTPFIIRSMEAEALNLSKPKEDFALHNRITDYPPESLN